MSGDARDRGWTLPPEDDWFAEVDASEPAPDSPPAKAAWHDEETSVAAPPPPGAGRGRLIALAIAAVVLVVGGILLARWASDSDDPGSVSSTQSTTPITLPTETAVTPPPPPPATQPVVTTPTTIDLPPDGTYRRGDEGDSVVAIQEALAALELNPGEIDGKFGEQTETAVLAFQGSVELPQDGVVGVATLEALTNALTTRG